MNETKRKIRKTMVKTYRNIRNENKYIEVHEDGYGHYSIMQYLKWSNGVCYKTGDHNLHRTSKTTLTEILDDYCQVV